MWSVCEQEMQNRLRLLLVLLVKDCMYGVLGSFNKNFSKNLVKRMKFNQEWKILLYVTRFSPIIKIKMIFMHKNYPEILVKFVCLKSFRNHRSG